MSRQSGRQPGNRGPIGGLFGLVGQGVGIVAEYNEHRKQQKQASSASQQPGEGEPLGTSSAPREQPRAVPEDLPPSYAENAQESEMSVSMGPTPSGSEKRAPSPYEGDSDFDSEDSELESLDDEEEWELDDLEREEAITPPESVAGSRDLPPSYEQSESMKPGETFDDLVKDVMATSVPGNTVDGSRRQPYQPLPCPVILPQRRPRKKARGFIRAYSPVLADCGIDQQTFLAFLKSFHKASQASPIFPVIQISAAVAGLAPSVIAMAVTTAVQVAAGVGAEIQTRTRTNNFLDRMNDELFKPSGLYAMIVKYKSDTELEQATGRQTLLSSMIQTKHIDLSANQVIAKYSRTHSDNSVEGHNMSDRMTNMRLASDTTRGAIELPEAAPLIFPDLDYTLEHKGPETFKDRAKDAKKFLADYMDRKAQMEYATQDPNSALAVPESERGFKSKLADPKHPMHSGGLIALLSGGKLNPRQMKHERRREKRLDRDARRIERGREPRKQGKKAGRYGDEYFEELAARTCGRRGHGCRSRYGDTSAPAVSYGDANPAAPYGAYGRQTQGHNEVGGSSRRPCDHRTGGSYGEGSSRGSAHDRRRARRRRNDGGPRGMVKRIMREDILYLMIVNMPSEADLEEARQELEMARGRS